MKDLFFKYQAQTSPFPLGMEVSHAKGSYIYDTNNNAFLDFYSIVNGSPILMTSNQDKEIFLGIIRKK